MAVEGFQKAARSFRPVFIGFNQSKNVLIDGIHVVGSPMLWTTLHILYSERVVIRGVILETFPGSQTDGMDIDSSRDVLISDCYLSGRDGDGRRVNRPTKNVTITNCASHFGLTPS